MANKKSEQWMEKADSQKIFKKLNDEVKAMQLGGNARAKAFFRSHGVSDDTKSDEKKYKSRAAELYKKQLKKDVVGTHSTNAMLAASPSAAVVMDEEENGFTELAAATQGDKAVMSKSSEALKKAGAPATMHSVAPIDATKVNANTNTILARKTAGGHVKKLASQKVSSSMFANFDDESSEEEEVLEASGSVTRADLASLALEEAMADAKKKPAANNKNNNNRSSNATVPSGRPVISSRLAYVDPDEDAKQRAKEPKGRDTTISTAGRSYDEDVGEQKRREALSRGNNNAGNDSYDARDRFGGAKSISSAQYFKEDQGNRAERNMRIEQFSGASSISSSQYFGEPEESRDFDAADVGELGQKALEQGKRLVGAAQNFLSDLSEKYNNA